MAEAMMDDSGPRPNHGALVILRIARLDSGLGLLGAVFYSLLVSFTYHPVSDVHRTSYSRIESHQTLT